VVRALEGVVDTWLDPDGVRELLSAYGIPVVPERVVGDAEAAVAAAAELGYPVVVKTAKPGTHKTEHGLLALDLHDGDEVHQAVGRTGVPAIVQPMVRGGAELLAGVVQDPVFGPLVAFGPGGVFAELIGEVQFRIAPITDVDANELVTTGKGGRLVAGFRGSPPSDAAALADVVLRLSRLAEDLPEVVELDLNPVIGLEKGCVAVDARVRVRTTERRLHTKTW
jgi:acyl-CoA synthetase (NDP forming)